MPEIQHADPAARRRALLAAAAIAVAGWFAFFALQEWLAGLEDSDPVRLRQALERAMIWGSWAACLPVAVLAAWLWHMGARVGRAGRYPPPGAKVIRDTAVVHGDAARLRATALKVLALFLGILCAGTLISVYALVVRIEG